MFFFKYHCVIETKKILCVPTVIGGTCFHSRLNVINIWNALEVDWINFWNKTLKMPRDNNNNFHPLENCPSATNSNFFVFVSSVANYFICSINAISRNNLFKTVWYCFSTIDLIFKSVNFEIGSRISETAANETFIEF